MIITNKGKVQEGYWVPGDMLMSGGA